MKLLISRIYENTYTPSMSCHGTIHISIIVELFDVVKLEECNEIVMKLEV